MNFGSTMRICDPRIWHGLKKFVRGSEATQFYLKVLFFAMQALLSVSLKPLERVYCILYGIFFLRMWRFWIKNTKTEKEIKNKCATGGKKTKKKNFK